jgi:endoglucanase
MMADLGGDEVAPLAEYTLWVEADTPAAHEAAALAEDDPEGAALLAKIDEPVEKWIGGWSGDVREAVADVVARAGDAVPVLVAYDIPERDCGGYSGGGADTVEAYTAWIDVFADGLGGHEDIAERLLAAGIEEAAGFALNTSNYRETAECVTFGASVSALTGGARFVVDTSRNGLGPDGTEWCNPPGRALGEVRDGTRGAGGVVRPTRA